MSERNLVTGRVRGGSREGQLFIGVQGDLGSYDRLWSGLTQEPIDILVIGDEEDCLEMVRILVETMLLEDNSADLVEGIEALIREAAGE